MLLCISPTGRQTGANWSIEPDQVKAFVELMAQGTSSSFMEHKADEDEGDDDEGTVAPKQPKVWVGSRPIVGVDPTTWDDNLQSAGDQLLGSKERKMQQRWSELVSQAISSKTAKCPVNDNVVLSVFPVVQAHAGGKEEKYTGKYSGKNKGKYAPHKSFVSVSLCFSRTVCVSMADCVSPQVHQHMQGVLNVILPTSENDHSKKRWELWHPISKMKWVLWARPGDVLWLPPGWHHQVTTFDGTRRVVRK